MRQLFIILLFLSGAFFYLRASESPRRTSLLNREWKYIRGDYKGAEKVVFDDNAWETTGLPHSFSIPYFMSKDFYTGYGWYRKVLDVKKGDLDKKFFLEFDGVFQQAEVFVNEKAVGGHVGGYTGFSVDISDAIKAGKNLVAVRVNNLWKPDVAPRAGEHVFSGGIYRNVRLVVKAPVHIDWYGTFITTPDLEANAGQSSVVKVLTDICNRTSHAGTYRLVTEIVAPNGKVVAKVESEKEVPAYSVCQFAQTTPSVQHPSLWCPDHPAMYKVITSLYHRNKLQDRDETTFGFRWFKWTADKGFYLNGKHYRIHGANVHQDQAGWGDAVTESAMRRDVQMMKEAGFNLIRGSHYPHAPAFSASCDEEGMLFWSEAPFWGIGGFRPDGHWNASAYPVRREDEARFEESALQQLSEMIRIHRNHPSIVAWSMCNEPFFSASGTMQGVRRLLKRMVDLSHRLDPTRPAAIGGAQRPLGEGRIDRIGDIAGYNGDGATQPDFQNPGIPNIVSEYGSTTAERPGEYTSGWGDLAKNDGWKGYDWRSGQVIWCGFDHGSIAGSTLGKMGIVDYFRIPKRSWHWYRDQYRQVSPQKWQTEGVAAQLKLEATKTSGVLADGTDDVQLVVSVQDAQGEVLSNAPAVTLRLVSGPGEFPTGTSITFHPESDIRMADGRAAISFRSYYAGTAVVEAVSPGLKPSRVSISFTGAPRYEKGITPSVKERPYIRFVSGAAEKKEQLFGLNNPVFASTWQEQRMAGMAADGNKDSYWQAVKNDPAAYWLLDTEKGLEFTHLSITFPEEACYQYKIEVSADRKEWKLVEDGMDNRTPETGKEIRLAGRNLKGRFVRITFGQLSGTSAALAEVAVKGIVCQ